MEQVIHSQLKHIHTNFMSEICYSIWFNGKKWSLRNGVGQTIAKMWILTVHPTSPQQFKVILSSFNSIRGLPTGCLCLLVKVCVFVKRNLLTFRTHSNVMYPRFIQFPLISHLIISFLVPPRVIKISSQRTDPDWFIDSLTTEELWRQNYA